MDYLREGLNRGTLGNLPVGAGVISGKLLEGVPAPPVINAEGLKKQKLRIQWERIIKRLREIPGASSGFPLNDGWTLDQIQKYVAGLNEYLALQEDYFKAEGKGRPMGSAPLPVVREGIPPVGFPGGRA